jgi:hypothetical protein
MQPTFRQLNKIQYEKYKSQGLKDADMPADFMLRVTPGIKQNYSKMKRQALICGAIAVIIILLML